MPSRLFVLTLILLFAGGCAGAASAPVPPPSETSRSVQGERDVIQFNGKIVHVPVEGGFFGIVADDGRKFDPRNLPEAFRRDGTQVRVTARPLEGVVGFHMWGQIVEIEKIEKR